MDDASSPAVRGTRKRGTKGEHDLAYGLFGLAGAAALAVRGLGMLPLDTATAGGIGILLALPLYLFSLLALVAGIALSVMLRDDRPLLVLAALGVIFMGNFLFEFVPMPWYNAVPVLFGSITLAVAGSWFLGPRRRRVP